MRCKLADEIFFFKRLIREAALRHDCFATFMAKPIEGEPGSAMHIHHSVVDLRRRARTSFLTARTARPKARPSCISSRACRTICPVRDRAAGTLT
jgi:glutamine synthetase